MTAYPWKTKGICLDAPHPNDIGLFEEFVEKKLVPSGINLIVMLTRYRYQFKKYPQCAGNDPLSESDVKEIVSVCRKNNIRLIPKMNLLGHQSSKTRESFDGLLKGFPEFDETPEIDEVFYCRSLCPNHPQVKEVVFSLIDDMLDAYEADAMHIGCDEVFEIGKCPRCKDTPNSKLFADWINSIHEHLKERGAETYMWGDRFLNGKETGYGSWEASLNSTEDAINHVAKDIIMCDWHYENRPAYKSVDIFADAGFKILIGPWRMKDNAVKFIDYAKEHDKGHIEGVLATTWCSFEDIANYMLCGTEPKADYVKLVAETFDAIFN